MLIQSFIAASLAGISTAKFQQLDPRADSQIHWKQCNQTEFNTTLRSECADFVVPLDYTTSDSKETIKLQIARIKAPKKPSKGTILLNFGGPGQPGRQELASEAAQLLALSGNEYDLAAFDPRGTANTIPEICFKTDEQRLAFVQSQKTWYDQSKTSFQDLWDDANETSKACLKAHEKTQPFLGTGFAARDLISVTDALGEDGMLRYWGFSYGTTLGATVASMFPERIDKLVIDGVQNPHQYYHAAADFEEWADSDRVFSEAFNSCARAGSEACSMARPGATGEQLEAKAWKMVENLKSKPIPVEGLGNLDYGIMRNVFAYALYGPTNWPSLSWIVNAVENNQTHTPGFTSRYSSILGIFMAQIGTSVALDAIHCSDRTVRLKSIEDFRPVQERLTKTSKVMDGISTGLSMTCAQWKSEAAGAYTGDFSVKTKNPILISTNLYDGHTPIRSARNVSAGFEGSGMLVVNGFGHTTLSQASVCTIKHTAAYWHDGTLPPKDFVCDVNQVPFSNYTWLDAIRAAESQQNNGSNGGGSPPPPASGTSQMSYSLSTLVIAVVSIFALQL